ncbi:MAG: gliding motility-associated C-terminal domain-containing protein, partial [Flavobacteriales bacterium]|nr:gliding motility-associated C-terminal domain-containing protein [Flavobacteriales bacterium]MCW8912525.1 gliding motility-associated C-terminal domain-containing protein [Flavobacteriales bacterium]MCW8937565.1 gliding motility-associated C-terminal domain-containing protein [Flavobacteriales bacterium]MCW8968778.1 gliding motility-associated C-terminal domain-containing protein [Flavobacteriales bacterium]MCW8989175.1 gliding motility-associated C-terminal domain-containing protein [Flavob
NVTQQGVYWVQVTNSCGSSTDTININYNPLPIVYLGNDTTLCQGETLLLDATLPNATYLWQDNTTNPTFNVTQQGVYWVQVTVNNCSKMDTLILNDGDCEILLEIPNVFTPNNDGINDLFVPVTSKGIVSMNTVIYNRWGNKIYETNKLSINWDGHDVSDGTYFWVILYTDIKGIKNTLKGYVTILK